jgi:hypothetical protein
MGANRAGIAAAWLIRRAAGVPDVRVPVLALTSLEPARDVADALLAAA